MKGYISVESVQAPNVPAFELLDSAMTKFKSDPSFLPDVIDCFLGDLECDIEGLEPADDFNLEHAFLIPQDDVLTIRFCKNPPSDVYRKEGHASFLMVMKVDYNQTLGPNAAENISKDIVQALERAQPERTIGLIPMSEGRPSVEFYSYTDSVDARLGNLIHLQKALDRGVMFARGEDIVVLDDLQANTMKVVDFEGKILGSEPVNVDDLSSLDEDALNQMSSSAWEQGVMFARDAIALWRDSEIVNSWRLTCNEAKDNPDFQFDIDPKVHKVVHDKLSHTLISKAYDDLESMLHKYAHTTPDMENISDTLTNIREASNRIMSTEGISFSDHASRLVFEIEVFNNTVHFDERVRRELEAEAGASMQ